MPTTREIHEHFLSKATWVNPKNTVDTLKAGDYDKPVKTVAVGWMATVYDLKKAVELGCDLFITHEPTFWEHQAPEQKNRHAPGGKEKTELLEKSGMAVLRCHDVWDHWPDIGIRGAWAKGLGLGKEIARNAEGWAGIYEIGPTPLKKFAKYILSRVEPIGQDSVQVMGDPKMRVSHPALGVGCFTPGVDMIEMGADCIICCFDGASYWHDRERFVEMGAAVITVEHGCSEHWGLKELAGYVKTTWPELTVHYLDEYPRPWTVK